MMTDTPFIDVAPFLERHERRTLRIFITMLSVSLVLSAIIVARGTLTAGEPGASDIELWLVAAPAPLVIFMLWIGPVLYDRKRPVLPDGSLPMNTDDARNIARVANAGGIFVTGMYAVMIAGQALWVSRSFGVLPSLDMNPVWGARAVLLATGALSIYFGNVWPMMPTPRAPEHKPATRMKYNRFVGWLTVILGVLLGLAAFLPVSAMIAVAMVTSISTIVAIAASTVWFSFALKSRSAS
jgi:hypothetical protein